MLRSNRLLSHCVQGPALGDQLNIRRLSTPFNITSQLQGLCDELSVVATDELP